MNHYQVIYVEVDQFSGPGTKKAKSLEWTCLTAQSGWHAMRQIMRQGKDRMVRKVIMVEGDDCDHETPDPQYAILLEEMQPFLETSLPLSAEQVSMVRNIYLLIRKRRVARLSAILRTRRNEIEYRVVP